MKTTLMKCGHSANARTPEGLQCCAICYPDLESTIPETNLPDLSHRTAHCEHCHNIKPSDLTLPFFEYREKEETDAFYCGCRGWD